MGNLSNHRARKRFGQNFLHDQGIIHRIVMAISPKPGQHIVEIGPGLGALTKEVLPLVGVMDAIELDRDLIPKLEHMAEDVGTLRIHSGDALKFDFSTLIEGEEQLRVFGNLPYNISTPLIFHLCAQGQLIKEMHFMLQKEVVERMAAKPGSRTYGRLSVMTQFRCNVTPLFDVFPESFSPQPKVCSSIVRIQPLKVPPADAGSFKNLERVVAAAFSQRRKTLRNSLRDCLSTDQILAADIDPGQRAEQLSLSQFASLARALPIDSK